MGDTIEVRTTAVDLGGLLTVLGDHLYSTPSVAVRELVQNAHDSIVRRRIEDPGVPAAGGRISVTTDAAAGSLAVEDDGAGLTRDEIIAYLATVGTGYTRKLREETGRADLIGLFGLGFLSAFVISERTTVHTTSWQEPDRAWTYLSHAGDRYTLAPAALRPVGTRVELVLKEAFRPLLEPGALEAVLSRYATMLPVPIHLHDAGSGDGAAINGDRPPWEEDDDDPIRARKARLRFAARFERQFEPICTFVVDDPAVKGLLWVQDGASYGSSDNRNLSVFVRGMLLDDDARDLLPRWAGFIGGVVTSDVLTPTASREDLQRDDAWHRVERALADAIVHGLSGLTKEEPETWRRVATRHNEALLGAAIADPRLLDALGDALTVPSSEGDLPVRVVLRRGKGRVYVSMASRGGFEEVLFRALKVPIVTGTRYGALPFATAYAERLGATVVRLGTGEGDRQVFRPAELSAEDRAFLERHLVTAGQELVAARFAPAELPLVLVPDRDAELKRRIESDEADKRISQATLRLARLYTATIADVTARLYVNLDSDAIQALLTARTTGRDPARAAGLLRALTALMSGSASDGPGVDLAGTLRGYTDTVCALLEGPS